MTNFAHFLFAGAQSIKKRLEEFGAHVVLETGEGMYHSYAMMPLVKEAEEAHRNFKKYISTEECDIIKKS